MLSDLVVGETKDLVRILSDLQVVQQHTVYHLPLLCDENIHYRVLKLAYSETYKKYDIRKFLSRTPLVYGTWHPYKYLITVLYRSYFPILTYLLYGKLAPGKELPSFPKLIFIERLFASLLHVGTRARALIQAVLHDYQRRLPSLGAADRHALKILQAVDVLLFQYIPAVFIIGSMVRDCHWGGPNATSDSARAVIDQSLLVLIHLVWGREQAVEYVRTALLASLLWSQWYDRLPSIVHSEEPCETLLGRLVNQFSIHKNKTSLDDSIDLFMLIKPPTGEPMNIKNGNIPRGLPQCLHRHLKRLVRNPHGVAYLPWQRKPKSC